MSAKNYGRALLEHFATGGTLNDSETEELYREAHGLDDSAETDLETVERWAVATASAVNLDTRKATT